MYLHDSYITPWIRYENERVKIMNDKEPMEFRILGQSLTRFMKDDAYASAKPYINLVSDPDMGRIVTLLEVISSDLRDIKDRLGTIVGATTRGILGRTDCEHFSEGKCDMSSRRCIELLSVGVCPLMLEDRDRRVKDQD